MGWLYSDEWAAGFFDGEGNVYLRKARRGARTRQVHAQVTQKDIRPLLELQKVWGGSVTGCKNPSGCYRWRVACRKAESFFRAIRPHVLVKSAAVDEALQERAMTRPWGGR